MGRVKLQRRALQDIVGSAGLPWRTEGQCVMRVAEPIQNLRPGLVRAGQHQPHVPIPIREKIQVIVDIHLLERHTPLFQAPVVWRWIYPSCFDPPRIGWKGVTAQVQVHPQVFVCHPVGGLRHARVSRVRTRVAIGIRDTDIKRSPRPRKAKLRKRLPGVLG